MQAFFAISYTQGLKGDKGYLPYLIRRGRLRVSRGHYMAEHGRDPTADFDLGEQDLNSALEKDPASVEALWGRAQGRLYRAVYKMPPGADPLGDYAQAEKDAEALTRRPPHAITWMSCAPAWIGCLHSPVIPIMKSYLWTQAANRRKRGTTTNCWKGMTG